MSKAEELKEELDRRIAQSQFRKYRPLGHPDTLCPDGSLWKSMGWDEWSNKPWQLEFHEMGLRCKERAIIAANGAGKSFPIAWETACHLLGDYPDWWEGFRFDRPVKWWVAAIDADQQREGIQNHILGKDLDRSLGTGFIPGDRIYGKVRTRQAGIADVADRVMVRHSSGGYSVASFKTFRQGWRSFQAAAPDGITVDEEPDERDAIQKPIFTECQTRIFRSGGIFMAALTPLIGETNLTRHFMYPKHHAIGMVSATWDDAPHLAQEEQERMKATYPDHEVQTRAMGVPMMGEGRVFSEAEEDIRCRPFQIPSHFAQIAGIDFGMNHPTAGSWLAWDRHKDIVYVTGVYRKTEGLPLIHAEAFKRRGAWIPVSWPHDGHKRVGYGSQIKDHYVDHGLNMLPMSARYDKDKGGTQDPWPVIMDIKERAKTGRFYVFDTCPEFFEEYRSYHVDSRGDPVAYRDDVLKATMYAMMMLRYAYTEPRGMSYEQSAPSTLQVNV